MGRKAKQPAWLEVLGQSICLAPGWWYVRGSPLYWGERVSYLLWEGADDTDVPEAILDYIDDNG